MIDPHLYKPAVVPCRKSETSYQSLIPWSHVIAVRFPSVLIDTCWKSFSLFYGQGTKLHNQTMVYINTEHALKEGAKVSRRNVTTIPFYVPMSVIIQYKANTYPAVFGVSAKKHQQWKRGGGGCYSFELEISFIPPLEWGQEKKSCQCSLTGPCPPTIREWP